jgi:hypothetical protein
MVVLRDSTALSSSVSWLLHWLLALVLSAARLVETFSRAAWIPALPAEGGSISSSSATDALRAAASAQAGDAAAVVPLAAVVVVAAAAPLVSSPEPPQAAARQTMARSRSLAGMGARMLSSRAGRGVGPLLATFAACGGPGITHTR